MKCSWCTFLSNDNYLLGAISLFYSLVNTKTQYDFFVACTNDVSEQAFQLLEVCDIKTRHIQTGGGYQHS